MKSQSHLAESIERFRQVFWEKRSGDRPPVGVVNPDIWQPIKYLRRPLSGTEVRIEDVDSQNVQSDFEYAFAAPAVSADDWIPYSAPWRAVPWLEAACGCRVLYGECSLFPEHCIESNEQLAEAPLPSDGGWLDRMKQITMELTETIPEGCWVSPSILRGPSDVLAAMRGLTNFMCDLNDHPAIIRRAAARINDLLLGVIRDHFSTVRPKLGGYGHIFGYWAPGPTIVLQEDMMGMCSPSTYREIFLEHNARLVEELGPYLLFHLHSTGYQHFRDVLHIPNLAGLEITVESNGPQLEDMLPVFREILEHSRLILFVDHGFDQLRKVLRQLPQEGLYLILRDDDVCSNTSFRQFVSNNWAND